MYYGSPACIMALLRPYYGSTEALSTHRLPVSQEELARMQRRSEVSKMLARLLIAAAQILLLPLARLSDKLVWSKVRHGLGGKVYTCLHTIFLCLVSGGSTLKIKGKKRSSA